MTNEPEEMLNTAEKIKKVEVTLGTPAPNSDEEYLKFLKTFTDRKEYNFRQSSIAKNNKEIDALKQMSNLKKHIAENVQVEEGFFDDFPPDVIK